MKGNLAVNVSINARGPVLGALAEVVRERAPGPMEERLADIRSFLEADLAGIEEDLRAFQPKDTPLHKSARHLIELGGKRIRPMCVALASRIGRGFSSEARDLAVAAELVHSATLLHDDVVDLGDRRRGAPTSRVLYGNAASIFAGDWLLVEALLRVRRTGLGDVLDRALGVLTEMLEAEALQLARRGRVDVAMADYMRVVEGKTASLFRWALHAGGRAGGVDDAACAVLERFGGALGVAFQIVDDALDVDGDIDVVGKSMLQDLREGKMTYPLMVALERDTSLRGILEEHLGATDAVLDDATSQRISSAIKLAGGAQEARELANKLVADAVGGLAGLPDGPETSALHAVAQAVVNRRK